jgi:hypothetical protein
MPTDSPTNSPTSRPTRAIRRAGRCCAIAVTGLALAAAGLGDPAQAAPPGAPGARLGTVRPGPATPGTVRVRPRLAVTAGLTAAVAGFAAKPANGTFVRRSDGRIFRVVGGAPLYVSSWTAFGGKAQPATRITDAVYNTLAFWPADGTFVRTGQDGRIFRFVGGTPVYVSTWAAFGGKAQPSLVIDKADLDHAGVEADPWFGVNRTAIDYPYTVTGDGYLTATSLDGKVYIRGGQTGRTYKLVGGAPQYVTSWTLFGGAKPTITVDQNTIDRAGAAYPYHFLGRAPIDQWLVQSAQNGRVYVIAGGAPLYVATPNVLETISDGLKPAKIDENDVVQGGKLAPWNHLRYVPRDDTYLAALIPGQEDTPVYQVTDGIPDRVLKWSDVGGVQPFTYIDNQAIANISGTPPWNHLLSGT